MRGVLRELASERASVVLPEQLVPTIATRDN
jgi:hypothetical protein